MAEGYLCWRPHASPGFDGWVMLVREEFETEDQAIDSEKARLRSIGRVKRRRLEAGGVDVEQLQLTYECGLVYNPPDEDEERVWALEYFKERMLDYVADDDELLSRLLHHQAAVHGITPLEAHERARWMHAAAERRRALSTLQKEQRSAFIARWLRKASQAHEEDAATLATMGGSPGASGPATPARTSVATRQLELELT